MRTLILFFIFVVSSQSQAVTSEQCATVLAKARLMTTLPIVYDGAYVKIPYPMGDVPESIGVCTDMVIRSFRELGIDLQELVHKDMKKDFAPYKGLYSSKKPDTNIDHRRVLNLRVYFSKNATELPITESASDYKPCDLVTWNLDKGFKHIGIISDQVADDGTPLIIHHIFKNPTEDNLLFQWEITGHYSLSADIK